MSNIHLHIIGSDSLSNLLKELDFNYTIYTDKNLNHNNQNLFVRIIFIEKLQLSQIKKYFLENIPTIFLLSSKDYLVKNNLNLLEFHVCLLTPIEVLSFKEILNILITKYNFFKKSKIIIGSYEIDSNQRTIIKNDIRIKITEKELDLILILNKSLDMER